MLYPLDSKDVIMNTTTKSPFLCMIMIMTEILMTITTNLTLSEGSGLGRKGVFKVSVL